MVVVDITYMDLIDEIKALGFECTYGSFKKKVSPPFTTIQYAYDSGMKADNQNYKDIGDYQLELYTKIKHPPSETLVQDKLKELRLPYGKTETRIKSEDLYQIVYDIQLIGG